MKTNFRIDQIIRNKQTGTKANVTAICNDYIVAVSYDHGAFRLYANMLGDFESVNQKKKLDTPFKR